VREAGRKCGRIGPVGGREKDFDAAVIGGGVIGLAVARALALSGREVVLLERESRPGTHTSSRNSEVIHAGFHYPAGSLKARLCVAGARALYEYAASRDVPHRRLGKLVVAVSEAEVGSLESYRAAGARNGVRGLSLIDEGEARRMEPEVRCVRALWSPDTGIIDSHALMAAFRREAEGAGAAVALRSPLLGGRIEEGGFELEVGGETPARIRCAALVNAAGPWAQQVASTLAGLPPASIPGAYYARGHYFVLSGACPFRHLVYPVAVPGGLGVHVTLDLDGRARFGPDVEWVPGVDYSFDEGRQPAFEAAIRRYWPGLREGALQPGYVGVRPKLQPDGRGAQDFLIQGVGGHGVPGLVNLYGIESPGLTASLAIAAEVVSLLS